MKSYTLGFFLMILLAGCSTSATTSTRKERKEDMKTAVKERVESGSYRILVNRAMPLGGRSVNLTSVYSLEVRNDSVYSYLPYFGRAYSVPYGGGKGLTFNAPVSQYDLSYSKRGAAEVKLVARNNEDTYTFTITVQPTGTAYISINMYNRQTISFDGELDMYKDIVTTADLPGRLTPEERTINSDQGLTKLSY